MNASPNLQALRTRFAELQELTDGWLDGRGRALEPATLSRALTFVEGLYTGAHAIPPVQVFPTPEGGIELEWRFGTVDVSLEFLVNGTAELHCLDLHSGAEDALEVSCHEDARLPEVRAFLAALADRSTPVPEAIP